MTEKFEFNKEDYKKAYKTHSLSQADKSHIASQMESLRTAPNRFVLRSLAVALAIVIIIGAVHIITPVTNTQNSFYIVANALELSDIDVKIASCEMSSGMTMTDITEDGVEPYPNEFGKSDMFVDFLLSQLRIKGENIASVSFRATKKSTYFQLYENGVFSEIEGLENSQYTVDEFEKHYDGFWGTLCDGFTVENTDNAEEIVLDSKLAFRLETDMGNGKIFDLMSKIDTCNEKITESKKTLLEQTNGGEIPADLEELYEEMSLYTDMINEETLCGATIEVTVKFTDGTSQSQTLVLGYAVEGSSSFLTARISE